MVEKSIHIVSLDVPFPANYGGAIDIFYKIKALHKLGVKITLHCFEYGRAEQEELLQYCTEVFYYKRKTGILSNFSPLPYIINSRRNTQLLENLQKDSNPIIFEGLHTLYFVLKGEFKNRQVFIRSHNIEHDYYNFLAQQETHIFSKLFFRKEAYLLKRVLKRIPKNAQIGGISIPDCSYLKKTFPNTIWLPPFHSNNIITSIVGKGSYALYHGNLAVQENITAALFIIKEFANKETKLIIAGKSPAQVILDAVSRAKNISLISNPENDEMEQIIMDAHVIILPTFQNTGIKLKLLESLYKGRFCIANGAMTDNTLLENIVVPFENDLYSKTAELMNSIFDEAEITKREQILTKHYNNAENAKMLLQTLDSI